LSTPITGVDSILATYGVFGWFFTIYRLIASVFISILAGFLSMIFIKDEPKKSAILSSWSTQKPINQKSIISLHVKKKSPFIVRVYDYAFNQLFSDIAKSLLIGIVLGSILATLIPADMTSLLSDNLWISYMFVLLLTGFSPGAVFVFLTAGPATSLITISIVSKLLGKKSLFIYLFSVILGTTIFAYIMDTTFVSYLDSIKQSIDENESASLLEAISTVIMYFLFFKYIFPNKNKKSCCS